MPDIPDRDQLERQYARALAKLLQGYGGKLLEQLGDPPNLDNLTPEFWDTQAKEMLSVLLPFGEKVFTEAARRVMETNPVGVDWDLINERAANWASRYTFDLVTKINDTTRRQLQNAISAYYREGQTIGQLEERIGRWFSPVRSELIAVTEVTRAAAQGELAYWNELRAEGIEMTLVWQTNRDELVCPLCGPLAGKKQGDGWSEPPPRHPRCRCWINSELQKVRR